MKHEAIGHPKMHDLATLIGQPLYAAHGIMEMLWHYAGDYAPDGDIGKLTDAAIARAVDWRGTPETLVLALVESRFLNADDTYRLIVHDWPDHAQEWVKKKLKRIQKKKAHEEIEWLQVYIRPAIPSSHSVQPFRPATSTLTEDSGNNCRPAIPSSHSVQSYPRAGGISLAKFSKGSSSSGTQVLELEKEKESAPSKNGRGWQTDKSIEPFLTAYAATGKALTDWDWSEAWQEWRVLDFEQRIAAVAGINTRVEAGLCAEPEFVMLPKNYLRKREWTRAIVKRKPGSRDELEAYWNS